ncbi:unnamed protein product [Brachionus calyciflorus]|uniref:R3H domain-containing protein n=1 Tax=Brachionus calyciflorus TaxID=104777 RepID=A0A813MU95_9BILA|nr:unnamed protein product [Brachionus calyciflorus]
MRGVNRKFLQSYLDEFTFRHNLNLSRNGAFDAMLKCISKLNDEFEDNYEDEIVDALPNGDLDDFVYVSNVRVEDSVECGNRVEDRVERSFQCNNIVELKFLDLTDLSMPDFKLAICEIIDNLKNKIYNLYQFRSNLQPEHRQIIYTLCEENGLKYEKRGTRYKKIIISTERESTACPILESVLPRDQHVSDVINIPVKREGGRPKKIID